MKRILLIDDDPDHLLLCSLFLQRSGYDVVTLSQPEGLTNTISTFTPDLIFVDHDLKNVKGPEVIKAIKSLPGTEHIPIIYFSSCDDIVQRAQEAGANGYLSKPFECDKLVEIVGRYLE